MHTHGWRWNRDGVWPRLDPGDTDPDTGRTYTAHTLLTITQEAGAAVALVGDRAQLPAVGRGGVLDMAAQIRGRTYDMTELHRFADAEYAVLTLTMRDRENPGDVFDRLAAMGLITLHTDEEQAREHITEQSRDCEAITVATNDDAATLNERIRTGRVESGEVDDTATATGSDDLPIGRGDLIQMRKNETALGVANRQQWIVQHVENDGTVYAREAASRRRNPRTVALPPEYVSEHAHLSYAATAYGVQGATVDTSHTMLTDATSAAGVYVGMTRGPEHNRLHVIAESMADTRVQFVAAMERDPADRGPDHAIRTAQEAVRGIVKSGPMSFVNHEAVSAEHVAGEQARTASWFGKRRARDEHEHARARASAARQRLANEWGEIPTLNEAADGWVQRVTLSRVDDHPRVFDAGAEAVTRNRQAYLSTNPA